MRIRTGERTARLELTRLDSHARQYRATRPTTRDCRPRYRAFTSVDPRRESRGRGGSDARPNRRGARTNAPRFRERIDAEGSPPRDISEPCCRTESRAISSSRAARKCASFMRKARYPFIVGRSIARVRRSRWRLNLNASGYIPIANIHIRSRSSVFLSSSSRQYDVKWEERRLSLTHA